MSISNDIYDGVVGDEDSVYIDNSRTQRISLLQDKNTSAVIRQNRFSKSTRAHRRHEIDAQETVLSKRPIVT